MDEEDGCSPPEISSFQVIRGLNNNIIDVTKKRKLELEQLDLPSPKHKYWDRGCTTPVSVFGKNKSPDVGSGNLPINGFYQKTDEESSYEESISQFESAKGSNSFCEDGDSAMSEYVEASLQPKYKKFGDRPSTSTASSELAVSLQKDYYSDVQAVSHLSGAKGKSVVGPGEETSQHTEDESQLCETLEEHLLEFGYHLGYNCFDDGDDCSKECADKEAEEFFGLSRDNYVLSAGRGTSKEETHSVPIKPTIDQEFEEYFSSLMM